jgi:hypothetical protein
MIASIAVLVTFLRARHLDVVVLDPDLAASGAAA